MSNVIMLGFKEYFVYIWAVDVVVATRPVLGLNLHSGLFTEVCQASNEKKQPLSEH